MTNYEIEESIRQCGDCHGLCEEAVAYCLETDGPYASPALIKSLKDCSQLCSVASDFMLRASELKPRVCALCAEACERCAQQCEQAGEDVVLAVCARACRRCAESFARHAPLGAV